MESTRRVLHSSGLQELPLQTAALSGALPLLTLALKQVLNSVRSMCTCKADYMESGCKALYILSLATRQDSFPHLLTLTGVPRSFLLHKRLGGP